MRKPLTQVALAIWSISVFSFDPVLAQGVASESSDAGAALPSVCDEASPEYNQEFCDAALQFVIWSVYEAKSFEEAVANKAKLVQKRTIRDCFAGNLACSLRATNDPKNIAASHPASFAYTLNNDGDDSIAISAAVKTRHAARPGFLTLQGEWQKNNQQKKEQDNLTLGFGYDFEFFDEGLSPVLSAVRGRIAKGEPFTAADRRRARNDFFSAIVVNAVEYNRKGIFGDATAAPCVANPALRACGDQFLETVRLTSAISPYIPEFEASSFGGKGGVYWVISPTATLFYDHAINDDVELLSGDVINGGVFGVAGGVGLAVSPGILDNRVQFQMSGQIIQALDRDVMRSNDFEKSSRLLTASLQFALSVGTYVGQKESDKLIPAFAITYTNGSDSLKGRQSQDMIVFALTLKY